MGETPMRKTSVGNLTITTPTHPVIVVWSMIRVAAVCGVFAYGGMLAGFLAIVAAIGLSEKE
jgi:hypothetical protein